MLARNTVILFLEEITLDKVEPGHSKLKILLIIMKYLDSPLLSYTSSLNCVQKCELKFAKTQNMFLGSGSV